MANLRGCLEGVAAASWQGLSARPVVLAPAAAMKDRRDSFMESRSCLAGSGFATPRSGLSKGCLESDRRMSYPCTGEQERRREGVP